MLTLPTARVLGRGEASKRPRPTRSGHVIRAVKLPLAKVAGEEIAKKLSQRRR
jgi:hypothetical protein